MEIYCTVLDVCVWEKVTFKSYEHVVSYWIHTILYKYICIYIYTHIAHSGWYFFMSLILILYPSRGGLKAVFL